MVVDPDSAGSKPTYLCWLLAGFRVVVIIIIIIIVPVVVIRGWVGEWVGGVCVQVGSWGR